MRAVLLIGFLGAAALAQFPGQYPGQSPLPGGRYPGGSPYPKGNPTGGRQPQQRPDNGRPSTTRPTSIATTTEGILRRATPGQVVIEADDHRIVWYRLTEKTAIEKEGQASDLKTVQIGDRISVDSSEDDQGNFIAASINWLRAGTPAEKAEASRVWDLPKAVSGGPLPAAASKSTSASSGRGDDDRPILRRKNNDDAAAEASAAPAPTPRTAPTAPAPDAKDPDGGKDEAVDTRPATTVRPPDPPPDPDDPGPPRLRRGAAAPPRSASNSAGPVLITKSQPAVEKVENRDTTQPVLPQEDPVIQKAREVAAAFAGMLPNFFCQQMTTRYQSDDPKRGWNALDIVTADVAYENGRETYKNIKVGNKSVAKPMEDIGGARSTGEFSSQLEALMAQSAGATFKTSGQDTIRGRQAWVFKFEVPRERSTWRIEGSSELYYPAYSGSVWIDKETSRVLRIEQEARNMPRLFEFDTVESATDYDFVRLGTPEQFLLPVEAEVLSCQRGTSTCSRNKIEFRNYRKFGAESSITFGDTTQ